jgi:hypothetical protein
MMKRGRIPNYNYPLGTPGREPKFVRSSRAARQLVTLPTNLGGWTYQVALDGGYTFTPTLTVRSWSFPVIADNG